MKGRMSIHALNNVSCLRLLRVQEGIKSGKLPDAVLCIGGVDGNFDVGCKNFTSFILPGLESLWENSKVPEELQDDYIICIKKSTTEVYCNKIIIETLLKVISGWNGLIIHCYDDACQSDDENDDFKVHRFISMFSTCRKVGIPHNFGCRSSFQVNKTAFDPMTLETWPIVHAYAYEEFGSHGFFTMSHEVTDITKDLEDVLYVMDPVHFDTLLTRNVFHIEKAWYALTDLVTQSCIDGTLPQLSEEQIAEPLNDYFVHYGLVKEKRDEPCVLIGQRSSELLTNDLGKRHPGQTTLVSCGNVTNNLIVIDFCDAVSPVRCTRTYFVFDERENEEESSYNWKHTWSLLCLYWNTVKAVHDMIDDFANLKAQGKAIAFITNRLQQVTLCDTLRLRQNDCITLRIEHYNILGRKSPLKDGVITNIQVAVAVTQNSKTGHGSQLNVAYGESFILSEIKAEAGKGSDESVHRDYFTLTSNVPRFNLWKTGGYNRKLCSSVDERPIHDLGNSQSSLQDLYVVLGEWPSYQTVKAVLSVCTKGIMVNDPQTGFLKLNVEQIRCVKVYGSASSDAISLLLCELMPQKIHAVPPWYLHERTSIVLAVPSRCYASQELYRTILPSLSKSGIEKESLADLPVNFQKIEMQHLGRLQPPAYDALKAQFSGNAKISYANGFHYPKLRSFLKHLELSTFCHGVVSRQAMESLFPAKTIEDGEACQIHDFLEKKQDGAVKRDSVSGTTGTLKENEIILTVICGPPDHAQSGPHTLLNALTHLNRESDSWPELRIPKDIHRDSTAQDVRSQLSKLLETIEWRDKTSKRVIILVSSFLPVWHVIHVLSKSLQWSAACHVRIGSVTACLNPDSYHGCTVPILFEQCPKGYVNNVVLTLGKGLPKSEHVHFIEKQIRTHNSNAAIMATSNCKLLSSSDIDVILSSNRFSEKAFVQDRLLLASYSPQGTSGIVSKVTVRFHQPLNQDKLVANLKGRVLYMEGKMLFDSQEKQCLAKWNGRKLAIIDMKDQDESESHFFFASFFGIQLELETVTAMIQKSKAQPRSLFTDEDVPVAEFTSLKKAHKNDPLPEGWFFSGTQYLCLDGQKSFDHPSLLTYVQDYVRTQNEQVAFHNKFLERFTDRAVREFSVAVQEE